MEDIGYGGGRERGRGLGGGVGGGEEVGECRGEGGDVGGGGGGRGASNKRTAWESVSWPGFTTLFLLVNILHTINPPGKQS